MDSFETLGVSKLFPFLLKEMSLFRASRDGHHNMIFRSAKDIYLLSSEISMYFEGNKDTWFLDSNYPEEVVKICQQLGCVKSPRIECTEEDAHGNVVTRDQHGRHERGLNGFDPHFSLDGLDYALAHPTIEKSAYIWNELVLPNSHQIKGILETSTRKDYGNSNHEKMYSKMGTLLVNFKWIPGLNGKFRKPKDFPVEQLPKDFRKDERLCEILELRVNEADVLAKRYGVKTEDINFIKHHSEEFAEFKESVINRLRVSNEFPEFPSINRERREEKLQERLSEAPEKIYEKRERSVRVSKGLVERASVWLKGKYTNEQGRMFCQICGQVMPFRKPNGEYYFESVEITTQSHVENEEQYLALCPTCAAKYKVFIKNSNGKMHELVQSILTMEGPEIKIELDMPDATIRFVDVHLYDLKTIFSHATPVGDDQTINSKTDPQLPLDSTTEQDKPIAVERRVEPEIIYKKKDGNSQEPNQLVQCPHCTSKVRTDRLKKHVRRVHMVGLSPIRKCCSCGAPAAPGSGYCYSCE